MSKAMDDAWETARLGLLKAIVRATDGDDELGTFEAAAVLDLAEAYAWVTSVQQPHGGRTNPSTGK